MRLGACRGVRASPPLRDRRPSASRTAAQIVARYWHPEAERRASLLDPRTAFVYSYWTVGTSPDPRLSVGLIGLGSMGTAIAERLLDAGYPLVVNNRTRDKADAIGTLGAEVAATPEALVEQVGVVHTSLADDAAVEDVAGRLAAAARPGTLL